ncbi:MAG: transcription antitermination factor NusB [Lachnospiraceae bacterium]|nr:transcription antitermination factor NusB [Lachnospiraceae bacterium]
MTRREMREHCFKILFGVDFYPAEETAGQAAQYFDSPEEDDATADGGLEIIHKVDMNEEDRTFLISRVEGIAVKIPELDEKINAVAQGWKTRRMGKVELTILRQALYEMLYDSEVPEKVAINEAVNLAKKYGGNDAPAFINGVLAKLVTTE